MKKICVLLTITFGLLLFSSCGDWLDVLPKSQMTEEGIFDNEDGYYSALAGIYVKMADKSAYGKHMTVSSVEIMGQTLSMFQASFIEPYYDQGWFNGLATYYYERTTRYNQVEDAITGMWKASYNAIANANELIANLEKQKIEVEGQLRAEDSKKRKKKDKGKLEEYKKAITSLENQIADSKQNIIDELMTTDLKSFASQLGSTLVDAFSQGTEGIDAIMQGKVDTLIKNMLAKQLSMKLIQKSLQPVFDAAEQFTAEESEEGVNFSTGEIRQIKGFLESSMSSISAQSKEWVQMMTDMGLVVNKDMSSRVQEVTGQLQAAMTEGTASQLVGLWNMTASDVRAIRDWLLTGTVTVPESPFNMTQMIELQNEIAVNTRVTAQSTTAMMHELGRVSQRLEAIDRNTRGYVGRGR